MGLFVAEADPEEEDGLFLSFLSDDPPKPPLPFPVDDLPVVFSLELPLVLRPPFPEDEPLPPFPPVDVDELVFDTFIESLPTLVSSFPVASL